MLNFKEIERFTNGFDYCSEYNYFVTKTIKQNFYFIGFFNLIISIMKATEFNINKIKTILFYSESVECVSNPLYVAV